MAETIEKITRTDPGNGKKALNVTERIILRRAAFRFILAIMILIVYGFTIYSLMYHSLTLDDKTSSLLQVTVGALTVLISQIGSFFYGDATSDTSNGNKEEQNKEENAPKAN